MPLLGPAAMLLNFDVDPAAIDELADWHTREHLRERLSIPGFLRCTRWIALRGAPRYLILYEVAGLATLTSDAYLRRLNEPSDWTARLMPQFRDMRRGLCSVTGSFGLGLGRVAALLRFKPPAAAESTLRERLLREVLPLLPGKRGMGSVHLLEGAVIAPMTHERRLRGADAGVDWALLLTAYAEEALEAAVAGELGASSLGEPDASGVVASIYRIDYWAARDELEA